MKDGPFEEDYYNALEPYGLGWAYEEGTSQLEDGPSKRIKKPTNPDQMREEIAFLRYCADFHEGDDAVTKWRTKNHQQSQIEVEDDG